MIRPFPVDKNTTPPAPFLRWLPWLITALALLTTLCLAQLYFLSRTENALLRDELALSDATAASLRNQLEAERLLARHAASLSTEPPSASSPVKRN